MGTEIFVSSMFLDAMIRKSRNKEKKIKSSPCLNIKFGIYTHTRQARDGENGAVQWESVKENISEQC